MIPKKEHDLECSNTYWSSEDEVEDEKIGPEENGRKWINFSKSDYICELNNKSENKAIFKEAAQRKGKEDAMDITFER